MGFDNVNVNASGPIQPTSTYKTKVLKGNHSFASQVTEPNMKYVIKHDFVLDGDVTIPADCMLEFDGGSISGAHTITGNNTGIHSNSNSIFGDYITISGTWNIPVVYADWIENVTATNNLRKAVALLSSGNKLIVGTGTHNLSLTSGDDTVLILPANTELQIEGEIKANTNNLDSGYVIIRPGENCYIHGGKITGDKDVSQATSEYGHGLSIWGNNTIVENVEISNCLGDGIYIAAKSTISGCSIHDCRRQGISVGKGIGVRITNNDIYNISGTNPQSCIDIESPTSDYLSKSIFISGNNLHDSYQGILVAGSGRTVEDVIIEGNFLDNIGVYNFNIKNSKDVIVSNNTINTATNYFYNIETSNNIEFSNNVYNSTYNNTRVNNGLYIDSDSSDIVIERNTLNYSYPSRCLLYNCIFRNNTIDGSGISPKDKVIVKSNTIKGNIYAGELTENSEAIVTDNVFNSENTFTFFDCTNAKGSLIFINNKVTAKNINLSRFYYINENTSFSLFIERNNIYDADDSLSTPPVFTKGVREWNYSVLNDGYTSFYNTKLYTPAQ